MADQKISALTALTSLALEDLLAVVDDPSGTPETKKITVENVLNIINSLSTVSSASDDKVLIYDTSESEPKAVSFSAMSFQQSQISGLENLLPDSGGWINPGETWTYASASTFTITGDLTGKYSVGDKIKLTQTTVKYFYITAVSYGSPNTTVTVTGGTDYTLANAAITDNYYSKAASPVDFPQWFNWTPTLSASVSMTFTSTSIEVARFSVVGRNVFFIIRATGTTGGTASNSLIFTLPLVRTYSTAAPFANSFNDGGNNMAGFGFFSGTEYGYCRKYDASNFTLGASRMLMAEGFYEI